MELIAEDINCNVGDEFEIAVETVSQLKVTNYPLKTNYFPTEEFNPLGLKVSAKFGQEDRDVSELVTFQYNFSVSNKVRICFKDLFANIEVTIESGEISNEHEAADFAYIVENKIPDADACAEVTINDWNSFEYNYNTLDEGAKQVLKSIVTDYSGGAVSAEDKLTEKLTDCAKKYDLTYLEHKDEGFNDFMGRNPQDNTPDKKGTDKKLILALVGIGVGVIVLVTIIIIVNRKYNIKVMLPKYKLLNRPILLLSFTSLALALSTITFGLLKSTKTEGVVVRDLTEEEIAHPVYAVPFENEPYDSFGKDNTKYKNGNQNCSMSILGQGTNMEDIWNAYRGDDTVIAVIDTGIDYNHPDFKFADGSSKILDTSRYYFVNGNQIQYYQYGINTSNYNYLDHDWDSANKKLNAHGTNVASSAASAINGNGGTVGIAPNAKILALKTDMNLSSINEAIAVLKW